MRGNTKSRERENNNVSLKHQKLLLQQLDNTKKPQTSLKHAHTFLEAEFIQPRFLKKKNQTTYPSKSNLFYFPQPPKKKICFKDNQSLLRPVTNKLLFKQKNSQNKKYVDYLYRFFPFFSCSFTLSCPPSS